MNERDFATQVEDLFTRFGWWWVHFRAARTDKGWRTPVAGMGKGFPDYICLRGSRLLVAEIKSQKGKLTPEQIVWYDKFIETQQHYVNQPLSVSGGKASMELKGKVLVSPEVYIWRPSDFDEIVKILR